VLKGDEEEGNWERGNTNKEKDEKDIGEKRWEIEGR
jgi:hypothetical protein